LWFAAFLGVGVVCLVVGLAGSADRGDKQIERPERLNNQCWFLRGTLLEIRNQLWSPDPEDRRSGEDKFRLQASEWQEAKACVLDRGSVGGDCGKGDRACMLHVMDWALAVVR
jgi:hypothetical protein